LFRYLCAGFEAMAAVACLKNVAAVGDASLVQGVNGSAVQIHQIVSPR